MGGVKKTSSNTNASTSTSTSTTLSRQAIFCMALLTIQFGTQPMLTAKFTPKTVCRSTVIVVQEAIKFCLASFMLLSSGGFRDATKDWSIASWIRVAALPAGLYTIQNGASLLAYQHLDGITFNVLNQTKTLSAALCCYLLIGRRQSRVQIISLFLLLTSALIIENIISIEFLGGEGGGDGDGDGDNDNDNGAAENFKHIDGNNNDNISQHEIETIAKRLTHGVAPVLFASFLSGLAGAISQKNLQSASGCGTSGGRNPYLFSAELCVASLIVLFASMCVSDDGERIRSNGFFDGWTLQTLIPIVTNSIGGIVVGLVTKYAGSVRKGFALIFGMLFTGFIQGIMLGEDDDSDRGGGGGGGGIRKEQIIGGLVASLSLWMHATHPYVETTTKTKTD